MSTTVNCPCCETTLSLGDTMRGRPVTCPSCKTRFTAPPPSPMESAPPRWRPLAIVAGVLVDVVGSTILALMVLNVAATIDGVTSPEGLERYIQRHTVVTKAAQVSFVWVLAQGVGLVGTTTGAYVSGRMGRPRNMEHAVLCGAVVLTLCVLEGVVHELVPQPNAASMFGNPFLWLVLLLIVPAAALGGYLSQAQSRTRGEPVKLANAK